MTHPIENILSNLKGVTTLQNGRGYVACCQAHNDKHPSLGIWEDGPDHVGICCYAGCSHQAVLDSLNITIEDLYRDRKKKTLPHDGIDMVDLAADKLIHPHLLDQLGITDAHTFKGKRAVYIPYFTMDGEQYERYRIRNALKAVDGSAWSNGKESLIPYGLHKLAMAREAKYLPIFEGESDCWTNWLHGLPALGIPGVEHYAKIKLEYLAGIDRIYISKEPPSEDDIKIGRDPGKRFVEKTYKHLLTIGYKGKVYVLDLYKEYSVKDPNDLHKRSPKEYKALFEQAIQHAASLTPVQILPETGEACDLMNEVLPPARWIVKDMIVEGMTLLGGKSKIGKSWFLLALALALSFGGIFLSNIKVDRCEVLYLALEDNKRRLQDRIAKLLPPGMSLPKGFHYALKWPRLDAEGLRLLALWLDEHPNVKFVIIDTWGRAKPLVKGQNGYDADVEAAAGVQELAMERNISILATCHTRKAAAEDALDELNATTGLAGTADNILILKRARGSDEGSLFGTGREIDLDKALAYNDGYWKMIGDAETYRMSQEQKDVKDAISLAGMPIGAKEIADILRGMGKQVSDGAIRTRILVMKNNGLVKDMGNGKYDNVTNTTNNANVTNVTNTTNTEQNGHDKEQYSVSQDGEVLVSGENRLTHMNVHQKHDEDTNVSRVSHVSHAPKEREICPPWLIPGTYEWNKQVERNGLEDMRERRKSWYASQEVAS